MGLDITCMGLSLDCGRDGFLSQHYKNCYWELIFIEFSL